MRKPGSVAARKEMAMKKNDRVRNFIRTAVSRKIRASILDGGWRMADGGWRMADGGWRMADGGWRGRAWASALCHPPSAPESSSFVHNAHTDSFVRSIE